MAIPFNPPAPLDLQRRNTVPQTIDDLFNTYLQSKFQQAQLAAQQNQMNTQRAEFASNNMGLTPERFNAGMQGLSQPPQQTMPVGPAGPAGQGMPSQEASPEPAYSGDTALVQKILQMHQNAQALGARQAQAGLAKTEAETGKVQTEADLNKQWTDAANGGGSGGIQDWAQSVRKSVANGEMAPSQAQSEASRVGPNGMGRMVIDQALKGLPIAQLEANFKKKEATASYEGGPQVQNPVRLIESAKPILSGLHDLAKEMGFGNYPSLNKGRLLWLQQTGDPKVADYTAKLEEGRAQLAQIFQAGGSPTDVAQKRADEFLPDAAGLKQLEKLTNKDNGTILELLGMRGAALKGEAQPNKQESPAPVNLESNQDAVKIRADYQSGKLSREQAKAMLGRLNGSVR